MQKKSVTLALKEYVGPDCPCGIEDRIREMHGVLDVAINPVADAVQLTYDADVVGVEHLKHMLAQLGCPWAAHARGSKITPPTPTCSMSSTRPRSTTTTP